MGGEETTAGMAEFPGGLEAEAFPPGFPPSHDGNGQAMEVTSATSLPVIDTGFFFNLPME